jgi:hypothetical protein
VTCSAARVARDATVMNSRAREALAGAFIGRPWRDTQITDPRDRFGGDSAASGATKRPRARTTTCPINRMATSVEDGWRESSR